MAAIRDVLSSLLAIPGVRAAVLVARDGLPIEITGRGDSRFLETLGALGASGMGTAEALGHELAGGQVVAAIFEYEDAFVSVDPVGEYAVVVTLSETAASLGNIRTVVRTHRDDLLRLLDLL